MKNLPRWLQSLIEYFSSSISKKIIIPYALLTLVLAAMGIFIITNLVAGSFEDRLKNQLLEAGRVVSDEIVNRERLRLEIERVVANTIGVADAIIDKDTAALEELLLPVILNARLIDSIIIVDTQGKEVLRFYREVNGDRIFIEAGGLDLSEWEAVNKVLANPEGNKQIQLAEGFDNNRLIIYTVGSVRTAEGAVGAALVGTYLEKELAVLQSLALAQLTLFNNAGQVIVTTFVMDREEQAEAFKVFTPERYRQVLESEKEVTFLDQTQVPEQDEITNSLTVRDRSYRLAYAPFMLRGQVYGVYAVALRTNFITDATNESRTWLIAIFSIGVVTVFGIGYSVSRRITNPILRLVRTSEAISAGDLNQRTGLKREDEIGILAVAFDDMTSDLQRLLQIQEEEASKLNAILNSIADGVIVQDLKGEIVVMNPAAKEILETVGHDLAQSTLQNIENSKLVPLEGEEYALLLNHLTGLDFSEVRRIDIGRLSLSASSALVLTSDGAQQGSVVVLRDITREVESEKLKDEFIKSISHELKTPLTAIKGYNNLLKMMLEMDPGQNMGDRQKSTVETMEKEVNDLDNIIQAMIDLNQIDAGELGVDQSPIDLSELIMTETEEWMEKMEEKELSFELLLPDTPVWVAGDHDRLARVIHNLIKNAFDYTNPPGTVKVLVKQENGQGQVDIKDTGVGIREEDQRFLFTKFFRAVHEESHFGKAGGAGLGLYISKAIVEAHEGQMWMESQPNHGSVFSFALPIIDPDSDDLKDW